MPRDTFTSSYKHKQDSVPDRGREEGSDAASAADLSSDTWHFMRGESSTADKSQREKGTRVEFPDPAKVEKGSTVPISVSIDGSSRSIYMHVPENYNASKPAAVLVVYNGWGDKPGPGGTKAGAAGLEELTGLSKEADRNGMFVLYMNGNPQKDHSYNNGQYPFSKTDDVGYTTAVLDQLDKNYNIDLERITLTGYSQGASFAHKAAAELPEKYRPSNLVDISGWTTGKEAKVPAGMNFMSIQSERDSVAPVDGRWFGLHMDSEEKTLQRYLKGNGIDPSMNSGVEDSSPAVREILWDAPSGAKIKSIALPGFKGHDWHGSIGSDAPVNATKELIEFIRNKRRGS
jgi:poly(3-hydroxybutyrate) depolymerase